MAILSYLTDSGSMRSSPVPPSFRHLREEDIEVAASEAGAAGADAADLVTEIKAVHLPDNRRALVQIFGMIIRRMTAQGYPESPLLNPSAGLKPEALW
jgi:hypothetical protein